MKMSNQRKDTKKKEQIVYALNFDALAINARSTSGAFGANYRKPLRHLFDERDESKRSD